MNRNDRISLSVPGALEFRDVAVRVVGAACKLLGPGPREPSASVDPAVGAEAPGDAPGSPPPVEAGDADGAGQSELADPFTMAVLSAFSEAFNNLALHGYRGRPPGRIDIEISSEGARGPSGVLTVRLVDTGCVFDPSEHQELPDELPERGMGLFIMRSFLDELRYEGGPPNVLTLVKRWP